MKKILHTFAPVLMERTPMSYYIRSGSLFVLPDSGGCVKNEELFRRSPNHHDDHVTMLIFFDNYETRLTFFTTYNTTT